MWRCPYCAETDTDANFYWILTTHVLSVFQSVTVSVSGSVNKPPVHNSFKTLSLIPTKRQIWHGNYKMMWSIVFFQYQFCSFEGKSPSIRFKFLDSFYSKKKTCSFLTKKMLNGFLWKTTETCVDRNFHIRQIIPILIGILHVFLFYMRKMVALPYRFHGYVSRPLRTWEKPASFTLPNKTD